MKILMIAARFHPHMGGVEKHLWELCWELLERGHDITILTDRYDSSMVDEEFLAMKNGVVRVVRLPLARISGRSLLSRIFWSNWLVRARLVAAAGLVHCHDFSVFIHWYLPLRFLFPLTPVFVTFHGWEGIVPPTRKVILLRRITRCLTNGNICVGHFIGKWYGTQPTFVTYGGVLMPQNTLGNPKYDAAFIGRLAEDTGVLLYLDSVLKLKERGGNIQVLVCGDGPLRNACEAFVRDNGLQVDFAGWVHDASQYAAQCKYIFTSGYLSILESMAMGKIVFSVYDNALKEDYLRMIPDYKTMMFVAGNSDELASQIEACLTNEKLMEQMTTRAKSWACNQTWGKVANLYEQLWRYKA